MKYRTEIDGLRAIAIIPVIFFHAGVQIFRGGFVGVDVFFVISGYLITTVLIEDIENGRLNIVNFYERRARRILPALFTVMIVCIPFAWIWMLPSQMKDFSQSLVAVSVFASNVLFWRESGYFAATAEEKPLLHTWSLALEEQYYLVFPIFLILVWRFGKKNAFWCVFVISLLSLLLSEWSWRHHATANFYLLPTRAWELLAGSMCAFIVQHRGVKKRGIFALLGVSAILCSIFLYDKTTPFPSVYTLLPILGVVLIILYAHKETLVAKLLSTKLLVGIGLISYSAYLWHQPLFAFSKIQLREHPSPKLTVVLIFLSLIFAYISWMYIEKPFRNKSQVSRLTIFKISIGGIACFTLIGLLGHFYSGYFESKWLNRQPPSVQHMYSMLTRSDPTKNNWGASADGVQEISECVFNVRGLNEEVESLILHCQERHGEGLLVLGDSHAIDLFGAVASREEHPFLIGITQGGCRPHQKHETCHYSRLLRFLQAHPHVFKLVVYEQAGFYLLRQRFEAQGTRSMFSGLGIDEPVAGIYVNEENVRLTSEFLASLAEVVDVNWFLPRAEPHISKAVILNMGCDYEYRYRPNLYETFESLDRYIIQLIAHEFDNKIKTVSQNEMFRFDFPSDFLSCETSYWSDGDHLSASGEAHFGERLTSELIHNH